MRRSTKKVALGGIVTALGVVLLLLGSVLGLGVYAAPMLVGWCLIPLGKEWGRGYQAMLWVAISVLSFFLVPDVEEKLMFAFLFGWYPILRPSLQKLKRLPRALLKLVIFNAVAVPLEAVVMMILVPESAETWMIVLLLVMANLMFVVYDLAIPAFDMVATRYFKKFLSK